MPPVPPPVDLLQLEELALRAWPAITRQSYDGWQLCLGDGFTGRANSVYPLQPSGLDLPTKFAHCAAVYREHQLPLRFRLSPWAEPAALDRFLAARGLARHNDALVLVRELEPAPPATPPPGWRLAPSLDAWFAGYLPITDSVYARGESHLALLRRIPDPCLPALLDAEGRPAACALGVCQGEWLGVFDVVVNPGCRRRGLGLAVMQGLLAAAAARGCRRVYLQVLADNAAALNLYRRLGFRELFHYWYRG